VGWGLGFGICAIANAIGLVVLVLGKRFYRRVKPKGSPFTSIYNSCHGYSNQEEENFESFWKPGLLFWHHRDVKNGRHAVHQLKVSGMSYSTISKNFVIQIASNWCSKYIYERLLIRFTYPSRSRAAHLPVFGYVSSIEILSYLISEF
jgi:hypothetical protein